MSEHTGCGNGECCTTCQHVNLPYPFLCTSDERSGDCQHMSDTKEAASDTYLGTIYVCSCCDLRKSECRCDDEECPSRRIGFNHPHYAVAVDRQLYNATTR